MIGFACAYLLLPILIPITLIAMQNANNNVYPYRSLLMPVEPSTKPLPCPSHRRSPLLSSRASRVSRPLITTDLSPLVILSPPTSSFIFFFYSYSALCFFPFLTLLCSVVQPPHIRGQQRQDNRPDPDLQGLLALPHQMLQGLHAHSHEGPCCLSPPG